MEINQASGDQSVRMSIQYDITMGNDVARMHIVTSPPQLAMMLLGTYIVMSQWIIMLLCVHIMTSQCIMTWIWTSTYIMSYYAYLCYYVMGNMKKKLEITFVVFVQGCFTHPLESRLIKHSLVLVTMSYQMVLEYVILKWSYSMPYKMIYMYISMCLYIVITIILCVLPI